jgi:hypothetical protein
VVQDQQIVQIFQLVTVMVPSVRGNKQQTVVFVKQASKNPQFLILLLTMFWILIVFQFLHQLVQVQTLLIPRINAFHSHHVFLTLCALEAVLMIQF